ncbi:MAG: ABC transporter permease subunit [Candidatus Thermoplasmatota archaeon]
MEYNNALVIAKKEIMDNIRNLWFIALSIIFASLTILASYAGSYFTSGWQGLGVTVSLMQSLVQLLIPIIALMLGYGAIVKEIEEKSMNALLSFPINRFEVVIGKFLGLGAVLSSTILIGFGAAGVIIASNVSSVDYVEYLIFIAASILIGLVFLNLGLLYSSFFKKRVTSMGMAIFTWFLFNIIWSLISTMVLIFTTPLSSIADPSEIPGWFYGLNLVNPLRSYSALASLNIAEVSASIPGGLPSFYNNGVLLTILLIWLIVPIVLASLLFKNRDI